MTQSAHFTLREAMATALRAAGSLSGVPVMAERRRPMPQQIDRKIFIDLEQSPADTAAVIGLTEWHTRFRVECVARDSSGTSGEARADALLVAAYGCLTVPGALGASVMEVRPLVLAWAEDEADTSLAGAHLVLQVHHRTPSTTIS